MHAPKPKLGRWSTYTLLGFVGYAVATIVGATLALRWNFSLGERLGALVVPPVAFIVVVTVATALKGREWIVFYQTALAAMLAVVGTGLAIDGRVSRMLDICALGVATFLVFGRLGCFSVACCHGRPASRGVIYGDAHIAFGLWARWAHRPLVPVQLIEAVATLGLVAAGLAVSSLPGMATLVIGLGYDGRTDWVMSSTHTRWTLDAAREIAGALWPGAELIEGRQPGVVHIVVM